MAAPRDGRTDHLLKYGGEENIIPHDSQVFYSEYADQGILKWEEISVDSDRVDINYEEIDWNAAYARLGGVGLLNTGYAYTEIQADSDLVALVSSQQVGGVYVNGRGYQGEPISGQPYLCIRALTESLLSLLESIRDPFAFR